MPCQRHGRGFTLIELLVVIAIIALLIGILLPALKKARDAGRAAVCLSNQRNIGIAYGMYAETYKEWGPRESGFSELVDLEVPAYRGATRNLSWAFNLRPFLDERAVSATPDGGLRDQFKNAPYFRDPARPPDPHNIHYVNNGLRFTSPGVATSDSSSVAGKPPAQQFRYPRPSMIMYLTCFTDDPGGLRWGNNYAPGNSELVISTFYDLWAKTNIAGGGGSDATRVQRVAANRHGRGANVVYLDNHAQHQPADVVTDWRNWEDGDYR